MAFGWDVLLPLMLLGGVVAVDGTSFGQFMVSRPFVAATIGGWLIGDPLQGAAIGVVLEAFHIAVLPVGAAKYPEGGPPAVAAGAVYAAADPATGALLLIVVFAIGLEWVGGESVRLIRLGNVRLISAQSGKQRSAGYLERMHLVAICVDFVRGMLLVVLGLLVLVSVERFLVPLWALDESLTTMVATAIIAGLFAGTLRIVGFRIWFAAAGAAGAFVLLSV